MDRPGRHGRPAHAGARRFTPLGHQIEAALAAGTMPGNEIRERIFPSAIRGGIGLLLRTKRHTATGKQIQVLVAAVNRHMPATPSRCCRRRRGRTSSGRKSWCESDDPAFAAKAADIVRLYMAWPWARLHGGDDLVLAPRSASVRPLVCFAI